MKLANFRPVLGPGWWSGAPTVFRSNTPVGAVSEDYPLPSASAVVIDLRTPVEAESNPHALRQQPGYVNLPLHSETAARPATKRYGLEELYRFWLEHNEENIASVFIACANSTGPTLICCSAGKDRTGIVTGILARLWGADDDTIRRDYRQSGRNMSDAFAAELRESPDPAHTRRMISSNPAALISLIHSLEAKHGSIAAYLREVGLNRAQVERLSV